MPGGRGKKKLTALKLLDNDRSKNRIVQELGIAGYGEPFIPEHLTDDAKQCILMIQSAMPPGLYNRLDSFLLAAYGMAWSIHKYACEKIASPNFDWMEHRGPTQTPFQSPWLTIMNEQLRNLVAVGGRLGLDPLARQGLRSPEQMSHSKFHGLIGKPSIEQKESSSSSRS